MSRSALPNTIEMALAGKNVARLTLEECELMVGSEYGVILQPLPMAVRSFEPSLPKPIRVVIPAEKGSGIQAEILVALEQHRLIEVFGDRDTDKIVMLRSLAHQIEMPHGVLSLDQADAIEDVLQTLFEQFYQVPVDVKASRAEIRAGLGDRQALIVLNHPALSSSEVDQLCQTLPNSRFVAVSNERRFSQADWAIELSSSARSVTPAAPDLEILNLLASVAVPLTSEQINAIVGKANVQQLTSLRLIQVEQGRYTLCQWNEPPTDSEFWMQKVLKYVRQWIQAQPSVEAIVADRRLLIAAVQWGMEQQRWAEVAQLVRSTEQAFAIAKLWGAWERLLRWGLQAAWELGDEVTEAWALHQLGTLAFCQEEVTLGYDLLKEALDLRSQLGEPVAVTFTQHNLSQLMALIVPIETEEQRYCS